MVSRVLSVVDRPSLIKAREFQIRFIQSEARAWENQKMEVPSERDLLFGFLAAAVFSVAVWAALALVVGRLIR